MKKNSVLFLLILTAIFSGCYYDNVEEINLLSSDRACYDTSAALALNYNTNVKWIIEGSCGTSGSQGSGCHGSGSFPPLTTYAQVVQSVNDYNFLDDIKHTAGADPMPKGGGKLTDCQIKVIENWINQGMPEN
jgi:hypothetical protein